MATKIRINFLSLKNENWWILHKFYTIKFFIPFLHFDRKNIFKDDSFQILKPFQHGVLFHHLS